MLHLTTETDNTVSQKGRVFRLKIFICKECGHFYEFYTDRVLTCQCGAIVPRVYNLKKFESDRLKYHITGEA